MSIFTSRHRSVPRNSIIFATFIAGVGATTGLLSLSGCDLYNVTRDPVPDTPARSSEKINGIPFLARVPQPAHLTKWLVPFAELSVSENVIEGGKATPVGEDIPGPIYVFDSQDLEQKFDNLKTLIQSKAAARLTGKGDQEARLEDINANILKYFQAMVQENSAVPIDGGQLLSNSVEVQMIYDRALYHLNYNKPLIGTVDGEITLAADGTLNNAKGNITDNTVTTALSTFPLGALISKAVGTATSSGGTKEATLTAPQGPVAAGNQSTQLEIKLIKSVTLKSVTLRKVCLKRDDCTGSTLAPLTLSDARNGVNSVEMASVDAYPPAAPAPSADQAAPSSPNKKN